MDDYSDDADGKIEAPKEEIEENTALVPKALFPDSPEVGKTCKVKVVHVYEDEVEIEYVKSDKKEEKEDSAEAQLDQMAEDK